MAIIPAKEVPRKDRNPLELLAELCYYYPQYSLAEARRLPAKYVFLLIRTARKKEAERYLNMVQIAAAPHTKKGMGVKKLINKYKQVAKDGR